MPNPNEIKRKDRSYPPAHFTLEIKSYSLLSNARSGDNYKSGWFSADKYKWKLILYPKGKKSDRHGNDHISLYLAIDKPTGIDNWRILVNFKLFMLNRIKNRYVTIQDDTDYFHEQKTQREFPKFLSLKEFKDRSHGYLVNDCCTFGAEIFVIEPNAKNEILTMVNKDKIRSKGKSTYPWEIKEFSKLNDKVKRREEFTVKGRKWKFFIYSKDNRLSLSMELADPKSDGKAYAEYKLRVKNHKGENKSVKCGHWFNPKEKSYDVIMSLKDICDRSKEYLKKDTLSVEVEFEVISETSIVKPRK